MKEPTWNELIEEYKATLKELQVIQFRMRINGSGKYWQMSSQVVPTTIRFGDDYCFNNLAVELDKWRDPIIP